MNANNPSKNKHLDCPRKLKHLSLLDHGQQELAVNLSSAVETFRLNVTQDRKARRGDFWVEYGQLTQTGSHAKDTIERRHKFFAEKMLALMTPQPNDLQTQL